MSAKAAKKPRTRKPKAEVAPAPPQCEPICEECRRVREVEIVSVKQLERALSSIKSAILCIGGHGHGNAHVYLINALQDITPADSAIEKLYRAAEEKRSRR